MTYSPNNRGSYGYSAHEVIKAMEDITIMEEVVMEIKLIIEEGVGHLKDRIEVGEMTEVGVTSRSRSGSRVSRNRDKIRFFKCRKYDHFARECPVR